MMTKTEKPKRESKKPKQPKLVTGMKDILPEDQHYWNWIRQHTDVLARQYGFKRIDTPILEENELFVRTIGETTDIVEKEMYAFTDAGGARLVLRPENTASVARAYVEHGMVNRPKPVRLYYIGPQFRRERPQAGRFRQHHQVGYEMLGDDHAVIDAQLILLANNFFRDLGLEIDIQVNSIGSPDARKEYIKILVDYYKTRKRQMCENCVERLMKNPLRLLDCKEEACRELALDAPQIVDHLSEEDNEHFTKVLEHLDDVQLSYTLNSRLIRGLDYYNRTLFEIFPVSDDEQTKPQLALAGGGRYDGLIKLVGGEETPAAGFALGIERLINRLREVDLKPPKEKKSEVYLAQLGEVPRKHALRLFEEIRKSGIRVSESFSKEDIKTQLEVANKLDVTITVIIGQKEILDDTVLFRDMENGVQEIIDVTKTIPELKKRLSKKIREQSSNGG